jgi:hypothetical protein
MRLTLSTYAGALLGVLFLGAGNDARALGTERILTTSDLGQPLFVSAPAGDDRLFIL